MLLFSFFIGGFIPLPRRFILLFRTSLSDYTKSVVLVYHFF